MLPLMIFTLFVGKLTGDWENFQVHIYGGMKKEVISVYSICFITAKLHTYKNITDTETVSKQRVNLLTNVKFRKK